MSLPVQIQKQVDAAKTIIAEHYGPGEGDSKPAEPKVDAGAPDAPAKDETPSTPAPAAPVSQKTPGADEATYEQRWRTLQGIHNATNQKLQDAGARLQALEQAMAALKDTRQAPAPAAPTISEDDIDTFGAPLIDFTRKLVTDEMAPVVGALQALRKEIAALKGLTPVVDDLVTTQRGTSEEKFFRSIEAQVPDWKTVNGNAKFHEWLLATDPMTGITRQSFLEDAQSSFNADRAVNIFRAWQRETGSVSAPAAATPNPAKNELELQVAPGRPTATPAPSPTQGKIWTRTDITAFYDDVRRGAYRDRAAEKAATERDLFLAQREGRMAS